MRNGKIEDKLLLESTSFDIEKLEFQNTEDETKVSYHIVNLSDIKITTVHSIDEKTKSKKTEIYSFGYSWKIP